MSCGFQTGRWQSALHRLSATQPPIALPALTKTRKANRPSEAEDNVCVGLAFCGNMDPWMWSGLAGRIETAARLHQIAANPTLRRSIWGPGVLGIVPRFNLFEIYWGFDSSILTLGLFPVNSTSELNCIRYNTMDWEGACSVASLGSCQSHLAKLGTNCLLVPIEPVNLESSGIWNLPGPRVSGLPVYIGCCSPHFTLIPGFA